METDRKELESTWTPYRNFTSELAGFVAIKKAHSEMSPKKKIRRIHTQVMSKPSLGLVLLVTVAAVEVVATVLVAMVAGPSSTRTSWLRLRGLVFSIGIESS